MRNVIPLAAVPSQSLSITINGQPCNINVYQKSTGLYLDLILNGVPITNTARCLLDAKLLADRQYLGFVGDLLFTDTQGASDPDYTGLGSRFFLVYDSDGFPTNA